MGDNILFKNMRVSEIFSRLIYLSRHVSSISYVFLRNFFIKIFSNNKEVEEMILMYIRCILKEMKRRIF